MLIFICQSYNVSYNTIGATLPQTSTEEITSVLPVTLPSKAIFTYSAYQENKPNNTQLSSKNKVQGISAQQITPVRPLPVKKVPKKKPKKIYSSAPKKNNNIQETSNSTVTSQQTSTIGTEEHNLQIPDEIEEQTMLTMQHEINDFGPGTSKQALTTISNEIVDIGFGKRSLLYNILSFFFII